MLLAIRTHTPVPFWLEASDELTATAVDLLNDDDDGR